MQHTDQCPNVIRTYDMLGTVRFDLVDDADGKQPLPDSDHIATKIM